MRIVINTDDVGVKTAASSAEIRRMAVAETPETPFVYDPRRNHRQSLRPTTDVAEWGQSTDTTFLLVGMENTPETWTRMARLDELNDKYALRLVHQRGFGPHGVDATADAIKHMLRLANVCANLEANNDCEPTYDEVEQSYADFVEEYRRSWDRVDSDWIGAATELEELGVEPTDRAIYRHLNNGEDPPPEPEHGAPPLDFAAERVKLVKAYEELATEWEKLAAEKEDLARRQRDLAAEYRRLADESEDE